jgi:hypothetical protein
MYGTANIDDDDDMSDVNAMLRKANASISMLGQLGHPQKLKLK